MARGILRIYLGSAPGVGKTFAMLNEGWRRAERGADVVVGYVETHNRANTIAQVRTLEVVPRRSVTYRDTTFEEMDLDAVLARRPQIALVDELAHTNVPGSRNEKRWHDVDELLAAGIDVITTVNIQHLESLNDVVQKITGIVQRETVPDAVVRRADQIELVDMSPEALRRRMAHGNIYRPEKVDAALANYFRPGNLGALRELALLWLADQVETALQGYMDDHGIGAPWETRERVVVAITGRADGDQLIRRASRIAGRVGGELIGVRVATADGLAHQRGGPDLERQQRLVTELGGSYREVVGDDVAGALIELARAEKATQIVLGASDRSRWQELFGGSIIASVLRRADGIDVHVISRHDDIGDGDDEPLPRVRRLHRALPVSRRRQITAWLLALVGLPLLTFVLTAASDSLTLTSDLLLYLFVVVVIAVIGGMVVGVVSAVVAGLLSNWFFVPPVHTLTILRAEDALALVVFIGVATTVSSIVDRSARTAREALRATAEARALARATATIALDADPLPELTDQLRTSFDFGSVAVLDRIGDSSGWAVRAGSGAPLPAQPGDGTTFELGHPDQVLVVTGRVPTIDDEEVLHAFARQVALALDHRRLATEVAHAQRLADADALRTALLQAVSHDLRTPLASIKASATSLLQSDVEWSADAQREFLLAIDAEADRLNRVVGNLLDMSRLQAGSMTVQLRPVGLEEVVAAALHSLSSVPDDLIINVPESLPVVLADPALLERAIANVVANAIAWSPLGEPVRIEAQQVRDRVHLRIVDRGPGVPVAQRDRIFEPFQRLGDRSSQAGVGLGLAVAKGFTEANGGEIILDDTPAGGLTVVLSLRVDPTAELTTAALPSEIDVPS